METGTSGRRSGLGIQVVRKGGTAPRLDSYRTGSAGGRRPHATPESSLRTAGYLMPLSRLIRRAVPFPPLGKNVIAVAVKR